MVKLTVVKTGQQNLTRLQVETFGHEQECQHLSNRMVDIKNTLDSEGKALADIQQRVLDIQNLQQQSEERLATLKTRCRNLRRPLRWFKRVL